MVVNFSFIGAVIALTVSSKPAEQAVLLIMQHFETKSGQLQ